MAPTDPRITVPPIDSKSSSMAPIDSRITVPPTNPIDSFPSLDIETLLALKNPPPPPPPRPPFHLLSDSDLEEELALIDLTREEWNAYLQKYPGVDPFTVMMKRFRECVDECLATRDANGVMPIPKCRVILKPDSVALDDWDDYLLEEYDGGFTDKYGGGFIDDDDDDDFKDEIVVNLQSSACPQPQKGLGCEENTIKKQDPTIRGANQV